MKYSICIVAYKAVDQLRRCLDSINASSIEDAEIIIWDNSPEPLFAAPPERAWSPRVQIQAFYNGINYGFAEGCNKAAKQAQGDILIFLNPDTQVFGNWADDMHAHYSAKTDRPIGAIGPISDFVAGLQFFRHHLQAVDEPKAMADMASRALAGRAVATKLLIGFCLMISADLYKEIGGMDGDLFLGCDDLDLSMRLRGNGYELLIASDVFVHHEGHKSFEAAGSETSTRLINETEAKFRAKLLGLYGSQEAIPTSTELWGSEIFYTGHVGPQKLSINLIVREEDDNLRVLLPQLGFADEVVLVDTKPDRPADQQENMVDCILGWCREVAPMLADKIKVSLFPWVDDFAAARNHALSLSTGDWVLWLDADDRVPESTGKFLRAAMDLPGPMTVQKSCTFAVTLKDHGPKGDIMRATQERLFPRIEGLTWENALHEHYGDRANALGLVSCVVPEIVIEHTGYSDSALTAKKQERNLRILETMPDGPHKFLHQGNARVILGEYNAAREAYLKLLDLADTWPGGLDASLMAHVRYMLASTYYKTFMSRMDLWQKGEVGLRGAFPAFPAEVQRYCVSNAKPDALFLLAEHHFFAGEFVTAKTLYERYASIDIRDFYGTNASTLQEVALQRLARVNAALEKASHGA